MASYVVTEKAERDLEKIIDYTVAQWGDIQAIQYFESLQEVAQLLANISATSNVSNPLLVSSTICSGGTVSESQLINSNDVNDNKILTDTNFFINE